MRIVIVAGHVRIEQLRADGICPGRDVAALRTQTGTRGERDLTATIAEELARAFIAKGHDALTADAAAGDDVRAPADLLLALHAQRDSSSSRAFAGSPDLAHGYVDRDAAIAGAEWCELFHAHWPELTGIPTTPERVNANLTDHYLWCYVARSTPCALAELGNMDLDEWRLFAPGPHPIVDGLVRITDAWAAHGWANLPPPPPPPAPAVDLEHARELTRELLRTLGG